MYKWINMEIIWRKNVYKWKFTKVDIADMKLNNWNIIPYEIVSRINNIPAVSALIENITNNTFVLVEQYRAPVDKKVIELVAWICDKPIPYIDIIREEIQEETWYIAKNIELIMANNPNSPWIISELSNKYYAQVEWERWKQRLEDSEEIKVLEFEKMDLFKYLQSKEKEWILISSGIYSVIWNMLSRWINILD